mgnify:CR=1 FL=1
MAFFCIPGPVAFYFCLPEVHVAFGEDVISATFMAVPEATVYEDDGPVLAEDEIGIHYVMGTAAYEDDFYIPVEVID